MFGGYGHGGGPGGFSGAERSKMMFADDMDEEDFDDEDYGTDEDYDDEEEEISATDSELLAMQQY